jgi:hypothetical protein
LKTQSERFCLATISMKRKRLARLSTMCLITREIALPGMSRFRLSTMLLKTQRLAPFSMYLKTLEIVATRALSGRHDRHLLSRNSVAFRSPRGLTHRMFVALDPPRRARRASPRYVMRQEFANAILPLHPATACYIMCRSIARLR